MSNENFSFNELINFAKSAEGKTPENVLNEVKGKISGEKMNEIKKIMEDKNALEQLLNSEQAQRLMKQFKKGD